MMIGMAIAFCLCIWTYNIYDKISYRKRSSPDEIRFPTQNDSYYKTTSIILGTLILLASLIWLIWQGDAEAIPIVGLVGGILVLLNGLLDLPKAQIKIADGSIMLTEINEAISTENISFIEITQDSIRIIGEAHQQISLKYLQLDEEWAEKIRSFLSTSIDNEIISINLK